MNYKIFFLIAALASTITFSSTAQERIPVTLDDHRLTANILAPSIQYEYKLNDNQSVTARFGIDFGTDYSYETDFFEDDYETTLNPFLETTFRNYYGRKRVKKELNNNSGNYIGAIAGYQFDHIVGDELRSTQAFYSGAIWGIQRNYKSGIHLGLYLGLGFATGPNFDLTGTGLGGLQLGFVLK